MANTRGGGEYRPRWHQAAVKENRRRVHEDFAAVAEDPIARKVTSPKHLGIRGESNGHGGAGSHAQRAHIQALVFAFLWKELK